MSTNPTLAQRLQAADDHRDNRVNAAIRRDLNEHVAEPVRSILNNAISSAAGAGTKDVPPPVVLGQGDFQHDGNGKLLSSQEPPECDTCGGFGRIEDADTACLRKCLDCNGTGRSTLLSQLRESERLAREARDVQEPACDRCCDTGIVRVEDNGPGEPSCVVPCNCRNPVRVDLPKPAARGMTIGGFVNACGEAMGMPTTDPASKAIAATHPGITQREADERTRRRVSRVRGRALCWPTVAQILNAPGRLTETLADLRQVEALRTAACCLEDKGPVAERMRQDILDAIHELDPASCPCCGIETETDPNPDGRGPWRACVSCSWNQSTRNEGGAA